MSSRKRVEDLLEGMGRMVVSVPDESPEERERVIEAVNRRLESARFELRRRSQKRVFVMAAVAALCLSSGFAWARLRQASRPTTEQARAAASLLEPGAAIRTGNAEPRVGLLEDGAEVHIAARTELTVSAASPGNDEIVLDRGRVELSVPKLLAGHTLSVTTPDATVTVRGTRFSVAVALEGSHVVTDVEVTRGSVWVRQGDERLVLEAGAKWSSRAKPASEASSAVTQPAPSSALPATSLAAPSATALPLEPPALVFTHKAASQSGASSVGAGSAPALEASTLAQENDLYAAASSAARSHQDALAVNQLSALLARYPSSPLAQNARVDRFRALARLGRTQEAVAQARRYLADYPNGFARDEAKALVLSSLANP